MLTVVYMPRDIGARMDLADESAAMATGILAMLQFVAILLAETAIAFAVFPSLLTGGVVTGQVALRRAPFPRLAAYMSAQVLIFVFVLPMAVVLWLVTTGVWDIAPESLTANAIMAVSMATLLVLATILFGLVLPEIVATGRFALGQALRWGLSSFWRLLGLLLVGALPANCVSFFAGVYSPSLEISLFDLSPGWAAIEVAWIFGANLIAILGTVLMLIALAKVYAVLAPPEEQIETPRVAEVFR